MLYNHGDCEDDWENNSVGPVVHKAILGFWFMHSQVDQATFIVNLTDV